MRTCRLRCRVLWCGAGFQRYYSSASKIASYNKAKDEGKDTLWCAYLISVRMITTLDGVHIEFLRKFYDKENVRAVPQLMI